MLLFLPEFCTACNWSRLAACPATHCRDRNNSPTDDRRTDCPTDQLPDLPTDRPSDQLIDRLSDRPTVRPSDLLTDRPSVRPTDDDDDDDGDGESDGDCGGDGDGDGYGGGDVTAAPSSSVRETSVLLTVEIKQHFVTVRRAIDAISLSRRWMEFPAV